jgi:hypothetical protein
MHERNESEGQFEEVTATTGGHVTDITASNRIIRELVQARNQAREKDGDQRSCCTESSTTLFPEPSDESLIPDSDDIEYPDLDLDDAEPLPGAFERTKAGPVSVTLREGEMPQVIGGPPAAEALLTEAREVVRQRRATYGPPKSHFAKTVSAINAIFANKLREPLTVADWAQIMILDKLARHQGTRKSRDTPIDLAGYAACLEECERAE